jgi:molybdopterin-dependent oxidoreductase alpha subunit
MMDSYASQFLLLTIDPVTGRPYPLPEKVLHLTLAGALLFDASFAGWINDDWKHLTILKSEDAGMPALNEALGCMLAVNRTLTLEHAVAIVAAHGSTLTRMVWETLTDQGLVARKRRRIMSDLHSREFRIMDLSEIIEIHKVIRQAVTDDDVPDVHVPALISLFKAAGLAKFILQPNELEERCVRIDLLAGMESLGREIIRAVQALESEDLQKGAADLIGLRHEQPRTFAGGMDAVLSSLSHLYREAGILKSRKIISEFNQLGGFECPGCAWPNPTGHRSRFEFCENGAKSVSAEATTRRIQSDFFQKWPVSDLLQAPGYWLEQQGRLTEPMFLAEGDTHYRPVSWERAFAIAAADLKVLDHPDEAVFYTSGKTTNETAFLFQLLARVLGTNNLPTSANLCHEPSGKGLMMSLGYAKSSTTLDDFPKADAIFLFGHNPGSNHPRMLSALQSAVRNGCRIVAVNPMPEASLMGFADPQEAASYIGKQTQLSNLYLQPLINGDMALVRGMAKALLEEEERIGSIVDQEFISGCTEGFETYRKQVATATWESLEELCGLSRTQIREAAEIYMSSKNVIAAWCLGITHHRNSVETIREIINLLLLRGNIGKPGAGVCPVRGHSNIQGIRTSGAGHEMQPAFLDALEKHYSIPIPRGKGMSTIPAIKAMAAGKVKVLVSLGGNLAAALPDRLFTENALRQCSLTVMISTKLNRSHLVTGRKALILPCLARTEEDIRNGIVQIATVEDSMGHVGQSRGCLTPASGLLRSETEIIASLAEALEAGNGKIDWKVLGKDNGKVRECMAATIGAFEKINRLPGSGSGFDIDNPLRQRRFKTPSQKALFSAEPIQLNRPLEGELMLMTIRSHDQFNTSIFGLNDRYRGIRNERRVIFMNREDMEDRGLHPEQPVTITGRQDDQKRSIDGYFAIPYPIRKGCAAVYFPEANLLIPIDHHGDTCPTPAYKSVRVQVAASLARQTPGSSTAPTAMRPSP